MRTRFSKLAVVLLGVALCFGGAVAETDDEREDDTHARLVAVVVALTDSDPSVRVEAVERLGAIGDELSVSFLEQILVDPEIEVREAAVDALSGIPREEAVRALALALGDADPALREAAVYALGEIGSADVPEILQQALADEQESVREAAEQVSSELSVVRSGRLVSGSRRGQHASGHVGHAAERDQQQDGE